MPITFQMEGFLFIGESIKNYIGKMQAKKIERDLISYEFTLRICSKSKRGELEKINKVEL